MGFVADAALFTPEETVLAASEMRQLVDIEGTESNSDVAADQA